MIKLRPKRFCRSSSSSSSSSKLSNGNKGSPPQTPQKDARSSITSEIKWELRPGGMLVQRRETNQNIEGEDGIITIRVSAVSHSHDVSVSVQATSTFGELKMILSLVTSLEPREQRLLFKGKERDDDEHLHMVGVRDKDKVLLLQDPAIKEKKMMLGLMGGQPIRV